MTPAATSSLFGAPARAAVDETSIATRMLQSSNLWTIGGGFLLFGLLLSFTPCVLPMVPILSSIIVGMDNGAQRSRWHGFSLLHSTYAALGLGRRAVHRRREGLGARRARGGAMAGFGGCRG